MPVIGEVPPTTTPPDISAEDGSFATWDTDTGTWLFVPGTTVMRTGIGTSFDESAPHPEQLPTHPADIPIAPTQSLNTLLDAGSYYFPDGISTSDAPPEADPAQAYVMAVTSSPGNDAMEEYEQAGIQILTLLLDPAHVWRRGFTNSDPTGFTDWILSGAAANQGLSGIQGSLDDPTQLPPEGQPGEAWIVDGDLWVWKESA